MMEPDLPGLIFTLLVIVALIVNVFAGRQRQANLERDAQKIYEARFMVDNYDLEQMIAKEPRPVPPPPGPKPAEHPPSGVGVREPYPRTSHEINWMRLCKLWAISLPIAALIGLVGRLLIGV